MTCLNLVDKLPREARTIRREVAADKVFRSKVPNESRGNEFANAPRDSWWWDVVVVVLRERVLTDEWKDERRSTCFLVMTMMTREESGDAKSDQPIGPTTRSEGERSF